jgi:hypothetical protein
MLWKKLLEWVLSRATLRIYTSPSPLGRRLGGADIPGVTDAYIILEITIAGIVSFTGYWQTA